MKHTFVIATILAALGTSAAVEVTGVSAKQRWPWNNLVDVDFTLTGDAVEKYRVDIDAQCAGGTKKFTASTFVTEPVVAPGANRVTWDFGKDYPGIRAEDMSFAVSVTPQSGSTKPLYMVVDLSAGSTATSYPVRYTNVGPAHTRGAKDEVCQTTELWLRRVTVPTAPFPYLWYNGAWCRLTKDFYAGIFEMTQQQYKQIVGSWPTSKFTNGTYRASRPVDSLTIDQITGGWTTGEDGTYPDITASSPMGKLRARTGLSADLPTLAQWELAARGGTLLTTKATEFYRYYLNGVQAANADIARHGKDSNNQNADTSVGTASVGTYLPNEYGLYDMLGNVSELVKDRPIGSGKTIPGVYKTYTGDDTTGDSVDNPIVNPKGPKKADALAGDYLWKPIPKGGNYSDSSSNVNLWLYQPKFSSAYKGNTGFRVFVTVD